MAGGARFYLGGGAALGVMVVICLGNNHCNFQ